MNKGTKSPRSQKTAKQDKARALQLSPAERAVLARRLAVSRNQIEKDALQSKIIRGLPHGATQVTKSQINGIAVLP